MRFSSRGLVNHLEGHVELSTKQRLLLNLHTFCELNRLNVFEMVPVSFVIALRDPAINSQLERFQRFFELLGSEGGLEELNSRLGHFPYPSQRTKTGSTLPIMTEGLFAG